MNEGAERVTGGAGGAEGAGGAGGAGAEGAEGVDGAGLGGEATAFLEEARWRT